MKGQEREKEEEEAEVKNRGSVEKKEKTFRTTCLHSAAKTKRVDSKMASSVSR